MRCPTCKTNLSIKVHTNAKGDLKGSIEGVDDLQSVVVRSLFAYWRWEFEGKPNHRTQYYYDPYHNGISRVEGDKYRFDIQLADSPEGDLWVTGEFLVKGLNVEILNQRRYTQ